MALWIFIVVRTTIVKYVLAEEKGLLANPCSFVFLHAAVASTSIKWLGTSSQRLCSMAGAGSVSIYRTIAATR